MTDRLPSNKYIRNANLLECGLTVEMLLAGIQYVYETLDAIDTKLIERGSPRLAELVELANLSTIIGNLFNLGIIKASNGFFEQAGSHKYQDLRATKRNQKGCNVEIKVALETNTPKGHLPKEGHYLTCRYVLGNKEGKYTVGTENRGGVVWIWEIRFGHLAISHFNISNTEGDSGKTAVVNKEGMKRLAIVYFDQTYTPYSPKSIYIRELNQPYLLPTTDPIWPEQ
ncbi:MAG: hypothetical protein NVS4B11_21290 [Ktedonobacteraceae bacterium]